MHEVVIPLNAGAVIPSHVQAEDYLRIIHDEYAARYLAQLGVRATAANKVALKSCSPLRDKDCVISGVWAEHSSHTDGSLAEAIKITAPNRYRFGEGDADGARHWLTAEPINVEPPAIWRSGITLHDEDSESIEGIAAASGSSLQEELEKVRQVLKCSAGPVRETMHKAGAAAIGKLDQERKERYKAELATLKLHFIFPFACEVRFAAPGRPRISPWPQDGPLDLNVPQKVIHEAMEPVRASLDEVQKLIINWVDDHMPLEFLTLRTEPEVFDIVRNMLNDPAVARLVGLVSHLFYWLIWGSLRRDPQQRLPQVTIDSMQHAVKQMWIAMEKVHRGSSLGVGLGLPCLLLTVKRCTHRCFEMQYARVLADEVLHAELLRRLNTLCMRLFDPSCLYARFGKLDGTSKAMALLKQLDVAFLGEGRCGVRAEKQMLHGIPSTLTAATSELPDRGLPLRSPRDRRLPNVAPRARAAGKTSTQGGTESGVMSARTGGPPGPTGQLESPQARAHQLPHLLAKQADD